MALPKNIARRITVGGILYTWAASGNDGWISLIIAARNFDGQKLQAQFDYHHATATNFLKQRMVITPFIVKQIIDYGIKHDWTPLKKGQDLKLGQMDALIDLRLAEQIVQDGS